MKKNTAFVLLILFISVFNIPAQTGDDQYSNSFDMTGFPQWAKNLRRGEIVAFGSFPFTMLIATTAMDLYRWNNANGMDFGDRRYAPWPLKSAGGFSMSHNEMMTTIQIAAGLSVAVAITDFIIVQIKRHKARKRAESLPAGTTIITRTPIPEESPGTDEPEQGGDAPSP